MTKSPQCVCRGNSAMYSLSVFEEEQSGYPDCFFIVFKGEKFHERMGIPASI